MFSSLENSSQTGSYSLLSIFLRGKFFFFCIQQKIAMHERIKEIKN